jgi:hypothetical protein
MLRGAEKRQFEFERRRGVERFKRDAGHRSPRDHGLFPRLWRHPWDVLRSDQIDGEHEFRVLDMRKLDDADASDFKFAGNCRRHRGEQDVASRLDEDLIVGNEHRRKFRFRSKREKPKRKIGFA